MTLSFFISPPEGFNTMTFSEIKDKSKLETIKVITKNSYLLFNNFIEKSYSVIDPAGSSTEYDLTISLPEHDQSFNPYSNFEYLFNHDKYIKWKEMIIAKLPELADEFPIAENKAKTRQELYRKDSELKRYMDNSKRYSLQRNDDHIQSIQQRITELRQELYSENKRDPSYKLKNFH